MLSSGVQRAGSTLAAPSRAIDSPSLTAFESRTDGDPYLEVWTRFCSGSRAGHVRVAPTKNLGGSPGGSLYPHRFPRRMISRLMFGGSLRARTGDPLIKSSHPQHNTVIHPAQISTQIAPVRMIPAGCYGCGRSYGTDLTPFFWQVFNRVLIGFRLHA